MPSLDERVALITGSSRGIGRSIALRFASGGCRVVVNYRTSREKAEEVAREINGEGRASCLVIQADVTREEDVRRLVEATVERYGRLDILVNNAGISDPRPFLDISLREWDRMVAGNLTSAFLCSKAALPHMMRRNWGRIINVSSTSGMTGGTSGAHYAAAKGGLIALTKAVSSEAAPHGITVNAVVPSKIATDMFMEATDEKARDAVARKIPVGRFGTPQEIAGVVFFLASDDAAYITGETIVASGGYR